MENLNWYVKYMYAKRGFLKIDFIFFFFIEKDKKKF